MKAREIAEGSRFAAWTVIGPVEHIAAGNRVRRHYPCRCECGTERLIETDRLTGGSARSCGCRTVEYRRQNSTRHGMSGTRLHRIWSGVKTRCSNPNRKEYRHYGGRGIVLCPEWHDFATFARWSLASGYGDTKELDRIDNNGRYSPDNCRWATRAENLRNTRQTQLLTAFGETKCVQDWGGDPRCQIVMSRILWRMRKYGWSAERAISTPPSRNGKVPA